MSYSIDREIARFEDLTSLADRASFDVETLCDHGILVTPRRGGVVSAPHKRIALSMMGIIHGNEWAGAAVINQLLALVLSGTVALRIPVAFILGNPTAARDNRRFLDRDLNRSFARTAAAEAREHHRAKALEAPLAASAYFVDFHQVSRRSSRPFFIFPFAPKSYAFARAIGPRHTVVTHWGKAFSTEGMCSDEYVNAQGGVGISFELGQNGFDPYQIAVGVDSGLAAIRVVTDLLEGRAPLAPTVVSPEEAGELYTWAEIVPWPEGSYVELAPDWGNFDDVGAGVPLGTVDGKPLFASKPGRMLFPKYLTRDEQKRLEARPTELCRLMRRITDSDLPT